MPLSTCCGAETDMTEIDICPECLEHCDWEDEEEEVMEIIKLPQEVNELALKISSSKKEEVQTILQQIFTGTDHWEKQVDAIEVKDINDKMSIELAEVARKNSKQARLNAEKIFDAKREQVQNLKLEFDIEDKLWLKAKQVMQLKFKAIEEKAEWKANFVKRFEAEQKELRTQNRIIQVYKFAEINRIEFENMSDDVFASFLIGLKNEYDAKIAAAKKAEQERIEKEKAEAEARELQRLENIKLKAEAEAREKELQVERAKAKAEAEAREVEQRKANIEAGRLRKEAEAAAAQLQAVKDAEAKAAADKLAAEEAELSKGDKQKMSDLLNQLDTISKNAQFKSKKYQTIHKNVIELIKKTIVYANSKI